MTRRATLLLALAAACGREEPPPAGTQVPPPEPAPVRPVSHRQASRAKYDHILITFEGAHERVHSSFSKEQAGALARSLFERLRAGVVDWDEAKAEYTQDRGIQSGAPLGPYVMVNEGLPYGAGEIPRASAARALGDMVFFLKPGEIGLVEYDPRSSEFGWHIVKRID